MEEMYILHELQGDDSHEAETSQEPVPDQLWNETQTEAEPEPTIEPTHEHEQEPCGEPIHELTAEGHNLEFIPIEEPGPNWEMELAQAYVRAQPLEGVFSPEEGLRMGTIFPNLSQPYDGRE